MSTEEQASVIGRAVLDYAESKKRLNLMLAKAERWGALMKSLAGYLGPPENEHYSTIRSGANRLPGLEEFPSRADIEKLNGEIRSEQENKRNLAKSLAAIGYDPKD